MLTSALGALVKDTKKVSFYWKQHFLYFINFDYTNSYIFLLYIVSLTSASGAPFSIFLKSNHIVNSNDYNTLTQNQNYFL
jgi:hypothetical protein